MKPFIFLLVALFISAPSFARLDLYAPAPMTYIPAANSSPAVKPQQQPPVTVIYQTQPSGNTAASSSK